MKKTIRRQIKVKNSQKIGNGDFQTVYRISPQRIVKIPSKEYTNWEAKKIVKDEVRGSKTQKFALPVLDIVNVKLPDGTIRIGTLRKYIPHAIRRSEWFKIRSKYKLYSWDAELCNFRIDNKKQLWRVDTQTANIFNLIDVY